MADLANKLQLKDDGIRVVNAPADVNLGLPGPTGPNAGVLVFSGIETSSAHSRGRRWTPPASTGSPGSPTRRPRRPGSWTPTSTVTRSGTPSKAVASGRSARSPSMGSGAPCGSDPRSRSISDPQRSHAPHLGRHVHRHRDPPWNTQYSAVHRVPQVRERRLMQRQVQARGGTRTWNGGV